MGPFTGTSYRRKKIADSYIPICEGTMICSPINLQRNNSDCSIHKKLFKVLAFWTTNMADFTSQKGIMVVRIYNHLRCMFQNMYSVYEIDVIISYIIVVKEKMLWAFKSVCFCKILLSLLILIIAIRTSHKEITTSLI